MTRLEKLQKIGLNSEDSTKFLIYSDQGLRWIKNTNGRTHKKEMDKYIDNIVSKPRKKIKEFVAFVKDKYFAPEGVEVVNEDFIRRWNGAYEVLNVQD
jgi:4-aminobutyrate aminotransferase-like enzyme